VRRTFVSEIAPNRSGDPTFSVLSRTDPACRLNTICPYYTMFPLDFPWTVLADATAEQLVLDPFCGRGTTLFAARLRGLSSVGIDASPVAAALARAKLSSPHPNLVVRRCEELLANGYEPRQLPMGAFWDHAYESNTLLEICRLREQLLNGGDEPATTVLRALLLGILHGPLQKGKPTYLSNQMPRTYAPKPTYAERFWRDRSLSPPAVSVLDAVRRRAAFTLAARPPATPGSVRLGDCETEIPRLRRRFAWIVTSPPYYGMRTYLPDQWLRLWFLGGKPTVDYSTVVRTDYRGVEGFVKKLATIWRVTSTRCVPGARLVVRLGALPSQRQDPSELFRRSIQEADAGWQIGRLVPAGISPNWSRQAQQFSHAGAYVEEVDGYASLAS